MEPIDGRQTNQNSITLSTKFPLSTKTKIDGKKAQGQT